MIVNEIHEIHVSRGERKSAEGLAAIHRQRF